MCVCVCVCPLQAMDEEMDKDASVMLMGEEVAVYHGAYKVIACLFLMSMQCLVVYALMLKYVCSVTTCTDCGRNYHRALARHR